MDEEKLIIPSIEHQNNLIINNSANANANNYNDLMLNGSDISIISGDQKHDNEFNKMMIMLKNGAQTTQLNEFEKHNKPSNNDSNNDNTYDPKKLKEIEANCYNNTNSSNVNGHTVKPRQRINTDDLYRDAIPFESKSSDISQPKKHKIPLNIVMGVIQLILSVTLVALGCLVLARELTLSNAGAGLWAGAIAAIAGSLGIINIPRAQTAFLALSLVCVASCTLALAFTGIGIVRDLNTINPQKVEYFYISLRSCFEKWYCKHYLYCIDHF